jgi:hypothetical protein
VNLALTGALSALSDSVNTRAVTVWTGFGKGEGELTRVSFAWEPNPSQTTDKPARLEIQPIDEAGNVTMPAQIIGGAPGELPLMARFEFGGGRQRIRFTAMAANGDVIDRWIQAQAVPDFSKQALVLATPKILRGRNMVEFRAIEANPSASPTAAKTFGPSDRVMVEIECQCPGDAPAQLKVDLLNAKGDVLRALEAPALSGGTARMTLPVGSLANSTYVLRIEATAGDHAAQQWVAFRVQR